MNPILATALQETPALIELFKALFAGQHPTEPEPTSEEVMAALESAFESSRTRDEVWLKAHPGT